MKRKDALDYIRIAGYHNDTKTSTRIYCEARISLQAANEAFHTGQKQKENGVKCTCRECTH